MYFIPGDNQRWSTHTTTTINNIININYTNGKIKFGVKNLHRDLTNKSDLLQISTKFQIKITIQVVWLKTKIDKILNNIMFSKENSEIFTSIWS